jgi:hypothetical protein
MTTAMGAQEDVIEKKEFISKFTKGYRFEPPKIEYFTTQERLTGKAGLGSMIDLFTATSQYQALKGCLPDRSSNYSYDSIQYALCILMGFWLGADCLEDLEKLRGDEFLLKKLGGRIPTARSIGDWLRDFDDDLLERTQSFLPAQALGYRRHLKISTPIVLDMDSTSHPQSGSKIEGVGWNYKNEWALDSLSCFCDAGFCYGFELRAGSTFSSSGAVKMLKGIVESIKRDPKFSDLKDRQVIYYRADSAFCNEEVMNACLNLGMKFTITAHGNMQWESFVRSNTEDSHWQSWQYTKQEIQESIERQRPLPRVEVCSLLYAPSWAENIRFKLVVKRTFEVERAGLFEGQGYWRYYAVITNVMDVLESAQAILEHHQQRGNAENRIKAFKGDYDLRHFPCLKMRANFAYGLMAMVALNFHRALSLVENPKAPTFSKSFRERLIKIPGRLVHHARAMMIKVEERWLKGVMRLRRAWHDPPKLMLTFKLRYKIA